MKFIKKVKCLRFIIRVRKFLRNLNTLIYNKYKFLRDKWKVYREKLKTWIKDHWGIILVIVGVILLIPVAIFLFSLSETIEGLLYSIVVYLFRPQILPLKRDTLVKMDNVTKYTGIIGFILLIHFLFGDHSFLTDIDYAFKQLSLDDRKGYVVGSILGFAAILWGFQIANERLTAFQSQNLEDRFIRSVELTGKKDLAIRLGGLAGLQALTHENAKMYRRVWEYLGSFLRNPPDLEGWKTVLKSKEIPLAKISRISDIQNLSKLEKKFLFCSQDTSPSQNGQRMIGKRPDIAYIAQILRDRNKDIQKWKKWEEEENFHLPLREVHLEGAELMDAYLEKVDLMDAHLKGAILMNAHLEGADLSYAYLKGAPLRYAHLKGTNLYQAHLEEVDLYEAKLEWTDLTGTDLSKAKYLTHEQFIGKKCRYLKGYPPSLPEEWPQKQRDKVYGNMEEYEKVPF